MTSSRFTVLTTVGWPADGATGPVQSLVELAGALAGEFRFKVLARERSFGRQGDMVGPKGWVVHGPIEILWCRMSPFGPRHFSSIMRETPHDLLMLNSFFDSEMTLPALTLRRLGRVPKRPVILSTRGEFSSGALAIRSTRKRAYLGLTRRLGLHCDVWLHATGAREAEDVRQGYPFSRGVLVAPNVRQLGALPEARAPGMRQGPLRLAFLGRISRVKNLDYALEVLGRVRSPVAFDIFGPIGEPSYWEECERIIARLPANVSVNHKGAIANAAVPDTLAAYDLFFLPTRGENFGHAIVDALAVGLPVLISDQTPFRDLEQQGAGWSLPLREPSRFTAAIESVAAMCEADRLHLSAAARRLAEETVEAGDAISLNRQMLMNVIAADAGKEQAWNS